ncbi:MAG: flagellar basal body P-ring formation chaperone FlgA [Acetobacteraceae bacterium]
MRALPVLATLLIGLSMQRAAAAELRPYGILDGPVVRLSDLFDGLGAAGHQVLGPGPAPGEQITVPAAQLAAIASEFGVAWQPRSPAVRAVLERPGRPLRRAEAIPPLQQALDAAGAPGDTRVMLPDFTPPDVPPGAAVSVAVSQLDYDRTSGAFSAVLSISTIGMDPASFPVSGRIERTVAILIAGHVLMPGEILTAQDVRLANVPAARIAGGVARTASQAVGMELHRAIAAGDPLPLSDLSAPPLVRRGQRVLILLSAPGIALTEQGKALEAGAANASIRVLNPLSHAVLEATVTGPGTVSVTPGSMPLAAPGSGPATGYAEYAAQ